MDLLHSSKGMDCGASHLNGGKEYAFNAWDVRGAGSIDYKKNCFLIRTWPYMVRRCTALFPSHIFCSYGLFFLWFKMHYRYSSIYVRISINKALSKILDLSALSILTLIQIPASALNTGREKRIYLKSLIAY